MSYSLDAGVFHFDFFSKNVVVLLDVALFLGDSQFFLWHSNALLNNGEFADA
jgi:hypothetical protein